MRLSAVILSERVDQSHNNGIVHKRVGFECICATISRQYTELFCKLFTRANESGTSMGGCNFGNILPINGTKCHGWKVQVFWQESIEVFKVLLSGTWSLPFPYRYCLSHEHSHSRKTQSQRKLCHS